MAAASSPTAAAPCSTAASTSSTQQDVLQGSSSPTSKLSGPLTSCSHYSFCSFSDFTPTGCTSLGAQSCNQMSSLASLLIGQERAAWNHGSNHQYVWIP